MRTLPILLTGCALSVHDSEIPEPKKMECSEELARMEAACLAADVVGTNDNTELYKALGEVKKCVGETLTVTCSQPGFTKSLKYRF